MSSKVNGRPDGEGCTADVTLRMESALIGLETNVKLQRSKEGQSSRDWHHRLFPLQRPLLQVKKDNNINKYLHGIMRRTYLVVVIVRSDCPGCLPLYTTRSKSMYLNYHI